MAAKKGAKRASTVPADETKRQKFIRLATMRVNRAVKTIELVGNLSGSSYEYTEADIVTINNALAEATTAVVAKFQPKKAKGNAPAITFA